VYNPIKERIAFAYYVYEMQTEKDRHKQGKRKGIKAGSIPAIPSNKPTNKKHMKRVLNVVLASLIALAFMSAVTILTGENSAQQMFSLAICFTSTALFYILVPKTK
jgi:uncharacterized membrane protein YgaE (UPF0421/DUF939 family)